MSYLEKLMQEIRAMVPPADNHVNDDPIPEDHDLLGEVPQEARQIYCLLKTIEGQIDLLQKEHDEICGQLKYVARHDHVLDELENLKRKHLLLHGLMWASIRHGFPAAATRSTLNIRSNWQLTASPEGADDDDVGRSGVMMHIFGYGR